MVALRMMVMIADVQAGAEEQRREYAGALFDGGRVR